MLSIPDNERLIKWCLWAFAGMAIMAILLSSCSPYLPQAPAADKEQTNVSTATGTETTTPAPSHTPAPSCTVSAELLNFRTGPGTGYEVTRVLTQDEVLTLTGTVYSKWIEVTTTRNETGWINSKFCKGE